MCKTLLDADDQALETFEKANKFLGMNILKICVDGSEDELGSSCNLQPAVAISSVAALESLKRMGLKYGVVAGHSLGEFAAAYAVGSITLESMCRLVKERAAYMEEANNDQPGMMTAILKMPRNQVIKIARESGVEIAVENILRKGRENIVISGSIPAVKRAKKLIDTLKESDNPLVASTMETVRAIDLKIPYQAHSSGMRKAKSRMKKYIRHVPIYDPEIRFVGNCSGRYVSTSNGIKKELTQQLTRRVRWDESIRFMDSEGVVVIYEVGAGTVLAGINKQITKNINTIGFDPELKIYDFPDYHEHD